MTCQSFLRWLRSSLVLDHRAGVAHLVHVGDRQRHLVQLHLLAGATPGGADVDLFAEAAAARAQRNVDVAVEILRRCRRCGERRAILDDADDLVQVLVSGRSSWPTAVWNGKSASATSEPSTQTLRMFSLSSSGHLSIGVVFVVSIRETAFHQFDLVDVCDSAGVVATTRPLYIFSRWRISCGKMRMGTLLDDRYRGS